MQVEVINNNGIVDNAFVKMNDLSFSVIINTKERWIVPNAIGFYGEYISCKFVS